MTAPSREAKMPKQPEVGTAGRNLIANVDRLRAGREWSWRRVSAELEKAGRVIPPLGLARFLQEGRRMDVDDLLTLAAVFGVTPDVLLADPEASAAAMAEVPPALRDVRDLAASVGQLLAAPGDGLAARQVSRALSRVQLAIEELLEERAVRGAAR